MTDPDANLLDAIRNDGSRDALDQLIARHQLRIRRIVRGMVPDDSAVDDLAQETFLRAFRGLSRFNGNSMFSTWLTRIAMNVALSHLEQARRSKVEYNGALVDQAAALDAAAPPQRIAGVELADRIEQALAKLTPVLRSAIVLTVFDRLPPSSAAELEGCPLSTLYWRIHEARRQLRDSLAKDLE